MATAYGGVPPKAGTGLICLTLSGIPYVVVHQEQYPTRQDAYRRERQIKRYKGGNAFKKLVQSSYSGVV